MEMQSEVGASTFTSSQGLVLPSSHYGLPILISIEGIFISL